MSQMLNSSVGFRVIHYPEATFNGCLLIEMAEEHQMERGGF